MEPILWPDQLTPAQTGVDCSWDPSTETEGLDKQYNPRALQSFCSFPTESELIPHPYLSTRKLRNPPSSHLVALPGNPLSIARKQMAIGEP